MEAYTMTREQARRFMLAHQGLLGKCRFRGSRGVLDYIRQAGCVQFDPIDVCGKNAELVLQSRVAGFTKETLDALLYRDRALIDYFDKNLAIIPAEDWKYFARTRARFADRGHSREAVDAVADEVKALVRERGFICARDLRYEGKVDWPWGPTTLSRAALETLYFRGELVLHHKKGTMKYYMAAADALGADMLGAADPNGTEEEHHRWMVARRIGAVGLLWNRPSDAWLGIGGLTAEKRGAAFEALLAESTVVPCRVEGISEPVYFLRRDEETARWALTEGTPAKRVEFLAPLDNMLWDRKLVAALFGFEYKWEIYTPVTQRRFGYYVLPVLYGDSFAGRIELEADKAAGRLLVKNIWFEQDFKRTAAFQRRLEARLERFARFNDCGTAESPA